MNYIKWGFESRLKPTESGQKLYGNYIKWGFESRLKHSHLKSKDENNYIKWGFESRLKPDFAASIAESIISNGDLKVG